MSLVDHAQYELEKAGLFGSDSDYDGMLGDAVMDLIQLFADQGHSGHSAYLTRELFNKLANWDVLSPLTDDPSEWNLVAEDQSPLGETVWQSRRKPSVFSKDGGKTWYDIDNVD